MSLGCAFEVNLTVAALNDVAIPHAQFAAKPLHSEDLVQSLGDNAHHPHLLRAGLGLAEGGGLSGWLDACSHDRLIETELRLRNRPDGAANLRIHVHALRHDEPGDASRGQDDGQRGKADSGQARRQPRLPHRLMLGGLGK